MSKTVRLSDRQRKFIIVCFGYNAKPEEIVADLIEVFPKFAEKKESLVENVENVRKRNQEKIKEIQEEHSGKIVTPALAPFWRVTYFRMLLSESDNIEKLDTKIKLLRELRAEGKILLGTSPPEPEDSFTGSEEEGDSPKVTTETVWDPTKKQEATVERKG